MTTLEFDVLDELYFLQSYQDLDKSLDLSNHELKSTLQLLLVKGWLKCYVSPTEEMEFESSAFEKDYRNYHYLATKAGLLAHNSNF